MIQLRLWQCGSVSQCYSVTDWVLVDGGKTFIISHSEGREGERGGGGRDDFTFKIRKLKVNLLRNAEKIIMFVARSLFHQEV